jgi:hypothetical protein
MGKLTATIRLESADIWPTPVKINNSVLEQANGDVDIQTITIPGGKGQEIFGPTPEGDASNTTYLYAAAANTNGGFLTVDYHIDGSASYIATLRPGDFMWLPLLNNTANIRVQVTNNDIADAKIDVLFANRG